MKYEVNTEELENRIVDKIIKRLLPEIELRLIHHLYDDEIKGYEKTSRMLDISESTIRNDIKNNLLQKNKHYTKKGQSDQSQVIFYKKNILKLYEQIERISELEY